MAAITTSGEFNTTWGDKRITFAKATTIADSNTWNPKGINRLDAVFVTMNNASANAGDAISVAISTGSTATFSIVGTSTACWLLAIGN